MIASFFHSIWISDFLQCVTADLVTWVAHKWFLSCVNAFMHLQLFNANECFFTVAAAIWLLSCVGPFMHLQNAATVECLVTFGADIWLLSCVGPFMCL